MTEYQLNKVCIFRINHPECVKDVLNNRKKTKKKEADLRAKIQVKIFF
jgi:hypothetical protein